MITITHQPFFQPIFDLESTRLAFGRVVLLGDFAFVARPHCGMGVTMDAVALTELMSKFGIDEGLKRYSEERVAFGSLQKRDCVGLGLARASQIPTCVIAAH